MSDNARWIDGNGLAGLLEDVFAADVTMALRTCSSCGARSAVGAHRAYLGAGAVLRCPNCNDAALRVATLPDRHVVVMTGSWRLELPSS